MATSASRAASTARNELIAMLQDDHKRARKSFRDFAKLDPHEDPDGCQQLVRRTCAELELHATLEEELFYPAARSLLGDEALIEEAEVEHSTARELIRQLRELPPDDEKFAATFTVLGEYVKHHVKEEENELFPQLARARYDWTGLLQEMNSRREALMDELQPDAATAQAAVGDRVEGARPADAQAVAPRGAGRPASKRPGAGGILDEEGSD